MPDTDDQDLAALLNHIDDQMRPIRVNSNRRVDFIALSSQLRISGKKLKNLLHPQIILFGLSRPEEANTLQEDVGNVLGSFAGQPVRHCL